MTLQIFKFSRIPCVEGYKTVTINWKNVNNTTRTLNEKLFMGEKWKRKKKKWKRNTYCQSNVNTSAFLMFAWDWYYSWRCHLIRIIGIDKWFCLRHQNRCNAGILNFFFKKRRFFPPLCQLDQLSISFNRWIQKLSFDWRNLYSFEILVKIENETCGFAIFVGSQIQTFELIENNVCILYVWGSFIIGHG